MLPSPFWTATAMRPLRRVGFTVVELLVVIAIIAIPQLTWQAPGTRNGGEPIGEY